MLKQYVLGFLFTKNKEIVWLIRKNRPDWQKGKLNGIGGKVEKNEQALDAMIREFKEETEAGIDITNWRKFCVLGDDRSYEVWCYYAFSDSFLYSKTDEQVCACLVNDLPDLVIPNLNWLIPMALSFEKGETAARFVVIERYEESK